MALLESIDIPLGTGLPPFTLPDPDGRMHSGDSLMGEKGLLLIVTCNHCPYAKAVWPRTIMLGELAQSLGIGCAAINPNINPSYPDDSPSAMRQKIAEWKIPFPYLIDADQTVAKSLQAQCTPDIYLFDGAGKLADHGRVDDSWQDEAKVGREELKDALLALAAGAPVADVQFPSMGCSIKWMT
jgi:hypothetical protein